MWGRRRQIFARTATVRGNGTAGDDNYADLNGNHTNNVNTKSFRSVKGQRSLAKRARSNPRNGCTPTPVDVRQQAVDVAVEVEVQMPGEVISRWCLPMRSAIPEHPDLHGG